MSETTLGETPVERRLREMALRGRQDATSMGAMSLLLDASCIDAGREALALLRTLLTLAELDYGDMSLFYQDEPEHPVSRAAALLTRCAEGAR